MADDQRSQRSTIKLIQAVVSLACITAALLAVAMSIKQWSAYNSIESSYSDILAIRDDHWLGISRQANPLVLSLAVAAFAPVVLLAGLGRSPFHYIACAAAGLAVLAAGIAWFFVRHM